jgi:hypothetical protein
MAAPWRGDGMAPEDGVTFVQTRADPLYSQISFVRLKFRSYPPNMTMRWLAWS